MGVFDWLKRQRPGAPAAVTWHVYRESDDVVADDGRGGTYRVALARARSVRIVPLTGGNPHSNQAMGGYQVAVQRADGDVPVGKPTQDWRAARDLARQVCETASLPLDELTERMFSRVGQFPPKTET